MFYLLIMNQKEPSVIIREIFLKVFILINQVRNKYSYEVPIVMFSLIDLKPIQEHAEGLSGKGSRFAYIRKTEPAALIGRIRDFFEFE